MGVEGGRRGSGKWLWVLAACLLIATFPIVYAIRNGHAAAGSAAVAPAEKPQSAANGIACLGRIEPEGGVIHVAAPYVSGRPPVVETLAVKEGASVRRGALLAMLAGRPQLQAALATAQAQTAVSRRRLEHVKAGPKPEDLSGQRAEIARLEVNLQNLQSELRRYEALRRTDDVTESEVETRRTAVSAAQRSIEQARHRLESLSDVPESDVHLAEAQLEAAMAEEQRARRELELTSVYAPMDGTILKVHAHAGEEIGNKGLLEMGRTGRMYVVAEVYETDVSRVRVGQHATISGDLIGNSLAGTVERVGMKVMAASVLPGDPSSFSDNRVVEVKIRLNDGAAVAGLIDGKVSVVIQP